MTDHVVPHFQEELGQLKTRLLEMGGLTFAVRQNDQRSP